MFGLTILDSEIFQLWQQKNSEVLKKLSSFLSREESNYYKAQSQKYLDKINPKTGILYSYEAKIERYKIANANKIEREKKKAIKAFQEQEKSGFVIAKN